MIIPGILASSKSGHLWAPSQDYVSISTAVVDASGATTITFSSIPTTYTHLQLRVLVGSTTADSFWIQFNTDTGNNYMFHRLMGNGTTATAGASGTSTTIIGIASGTGFPSATSTYGVAIIDILDYTSTNKNKTVRTLSGYDANGTGGISIESGLWFATPAAINSIKITSASGSLRQYSSFALYGVK